MSWVRPVSPVFAASLLLACSDSGAPNPAAPPAAPASNSSPSFSSAASIAIDENALGVVYTLAAADADGAIVRLALVNTPDATSFAFDSTTGELVLPARLAFASPSDFDGDNIYQLTFEAEDDDGAVSSLNVQVTITEAALKASLPPSGNFELIDWKLDLPVDSSGAFSGASDTILENDLANGYESDFFYTGPDGGLVMRSPVIGATTPNSSFARTELREMLRRGDASISTRGAGNIPNENNWALSSQPAAAQSGAGGVDGTLSVTMSVNNVTTTGTSGQVGRLIIGQIHAKNDEPVRLYYRKLPSNTRGVIYAEHEIAGGADIRFEILGDSSNNATDPVDGVSLNERFTYEIIANGNMLTVNIYNDARNLLGFADIDMSASGYDVLDDFMYFKAGAYHVNNSADPAEFAQVTIYELSNTHIGYPF
jgi:poly(beta-D-mannuronate) lyase